jgi:hypothetical protein
MREIFYNFSCYDALTFEISTIGKTMMFLKELYMVEITSSHFSETELVQRMTRFLRLMLICKFCHFAEILVAIALAFLGAKMKGSFIRYSKYEEEKKCWMGSQVTKLEMWLTSTMSLVKDEDE